MIIEQESSTNGSHASLDEEDPNPNIASHVDDVASGAAFAEASQTATTDIRVPLEDEQDVDDEYRFARYLAHNWRHYMSTSGVDLEFGRIGGIECGYGSLPNAPRARRVVMRDLEIEAALNSSITNATSTENGNSDFDDLSLASHLLDNCLICYQQQAHDGFHTLTLCRHTLCKTCLSGVIGSTLRGFRVDGIRCPFSDRCPKLHPNDVLPYVADHPDLLARWEHYQLKQALVTEYKARWCPGENCSFVVVGSAKCPRMRCEVPGCKTEFCYFCRGVWHSGRCKKEGLWRRKMPETKSCPKCKTRIKKDGGCQFMVCSVCSQEFCWACCKPARESDGSDLHALIFSKDRCLNAYRHSNVAAKLAMLALLWLFVPFAAPGIALLLAGTLTLLHPLLLFRQGRNKYAILAILCYPISIIGAACVSFWIIVFILLYGVSIMLLAPLILFGTDHLSAQAISLTRKPNYMAQYFIYVLTETAH